MSIVERYTPGTFSYAELATTDAASARAFYTGLFGWEVDEIPMGGAGTYYMFRRGEHVAAAMHQMGPEQAAGVPPHWGSYVTVASVDESAARAEELSGTVLMAPFDVMDAGRMAVVRDPTGAVFSLWEARAHPGAQVLDEPGALCWNELATPDPVRAGGFYTALFGWTTQVNDMGTMIYTTFMRGEERAGGMYGITEEMEGMPPLWMVYFAVEDCDASTARARELGAQVHVTPADIPGVGRFAMMADPQGAMFSIITLLPMQEGEPTRQDAVPSAAGDAQN
ncbi:MAG: VOC family protein [Longimicrobiaceae bacterium]